VKLDNYLHAKISDFGLAKTKEHSKTNTLVDALGTVAWAAPEYLTGKRYQERNEKGDVFSFGVIVWELLTRHIPWKAEGYSAKDIQHHIKRGERLVIPPCPTILQEIMTQCWKDSM
jgi:serine/threonine protein kinase